jgi:hypothetical protein
MSSKGSRDQLMRLQAAVTLFVKQQCLRALQGGQEEWENLSDENLDVLEKVLPIIEEALDEDHAEQLDELHIPAFPGPFMPKMFKVPGFPSFSFPQFKSRCRATKGDGATCEIIDDFRDDLRVELRKARRHDRGLTEEELNKLLERLREGLVSIVTQSPRGRREKAREEA